MLNLQMRLKLAERVTIITLCACPSLLKPLPLNQLNRSKFNCGSSCYETDTEVPA